MASRAPKPNSYHPRHERTWVRHHDRRIQQPVPTVATFLLAMPALCRDELCRIAEWAIDRMDAIDGDVDLEPCEALDDIGSNVLPFGKIGFVEIPNHDGDDDPAGGDVCDELHDREYFPLLPAYGIDQSQGPLNEVEAAGDYHRRLACGSGR